MKIKPLKLHLFESILNDISRFQIPNSREILPISLRCHMRAIALDPDFKLPLVY